MHLQPERVSSAIREFHEFQLLVQFQKYSSSCFYDVKTTALQVCEVPTVPANGNGIALTYCEK